MVFRRTTHGMNLQHRSFSPRTLEGRLPRTRKGHSPTRHVVQTLTTPRRQERPSIHSTALTRLTYKSDWANSVSSPGKMTACGDQLHAVRSEISRRKTVCRRTISGTPRPSVRSKRGRPQKHFLADGPTIPRTAKLLNSNNRA